MVSINPTSPQSSPVIRHNPWLHSLGATITQDFTVAKLAILDPGRDINTPLEAKFEAMKISEKTWHSFHCWFSNLLTLSTSVYMLPIILWLFLVMHQLWDLPKKLTYITMCLQLNNLLMHNSISHISYLINITLLSLFHFTKSGLGFMHSCTTFPGLMNDLCS